MPAIAKDLELTQAPYRLSGTVVAALLNHQQDWRLLGTTATRAPYQAPPKHPVLAVRPPNTWCLPGEPIVLPAGEAGWIPGACLGIVMGRSASRVPESRALDAVAAYLVANDGSLPLSSHYRPALRQRARDGFCAFSREPVPAQAVTDPDALGVELRIDGLPVQDTDTGSRVRPVARLIADISCFMTLAPGDLLLLGAAPGAPAVRAGQTVSVTIAGIGEISNRVVGEAAT